MSIVVPELDLADLDGETSNCGHGVNYFVYREGKNTWSIPKSSDKKLDKSKMVTHVCFASLILRLCEKSSPKNRVLYLIRDRAEVPLKSKEMLDFLNIAQANKAIPDYVDVEQVVEKRKFVLKVDSTIPNDLIYTYLTTVRMLEEEVGFVRNMITLINKYKMPFGLAWMVASRLSIRNSWHNIVSVGTAMGMYGSCRGNTLEEKLESTIDVVLAMAITKYLNKRTMEKFNIKPKDRNSGFYTSNEIQKMVSKIKPDSKKDLSQMKMVKVFDEKIYKKFDKI